MSISREDVLRVAELAHLELTPAEVELYRGQLDEILNYVGKLQELDLTGVEPMSQVLPRSHGAASYSAQGAILAGADGDSERHPELRDDVVHPCDVADAVLAQAPDAVKPFFRVPKVIDR
jgi:aspartyl-tRNA(Asn)/glutamyl-tRNA(Gln) amidotransferase subunit C